ncbi:MAG: transcriptional regulator [Mucilaginibacter sp.]|jgi:transcriptional regulator with XRE-family HTH domain|nr:transcriptional regulator [Mucilaginibacter sp.]
MKALDLRTKAVAYNIRKIRELRDYSQDYLAAKLNISQNAYSKIELGYSDITLNRLFNISTILEVELTDLINLDSNELIQKVAADNMVTAKQNHNL